MEQKNLHGGRKTSSVKEKEVMSV